MAIDTAEKRKSASGVGGVPLIPGVTPNSLKDAEWRQQSAWSYSGISAVDLPEPGGTPPYRPLATLGADTLRQATLASDTFRQSPAASDTFRESPDQQID